MFARLISLCQTLFRRRRLEAEMAEELRFHLESRTADLVRSGMNPAEAERRARIDFGCVEARKEDCREAKGSRFFDELSRDITFGVRSLSRSPAFTLAAVATLALGIGANCLVFSVLDGLFLRPLPFREPDRLVLVWNLDSHSGAKFQPSLPLYHEWRAGNEVFAEMGMCVPASFDYRGDTYAERLHGRLATASLFITMAVRAQVGRLFVPEDERAGHEHVVVLSDRLWRSRFQADPGVVGRILLLSRNGEPAAKFTVVGLFRPPCSQPFRSMPTFGRPSRWMGKRPICDAEAFRERWWRV